MCYWRRDRGQETKSSCVVWKNSPMLLILSSAGAGAHQCDQRLCVINPAAHAWFYYSHIIILCEATQSLPKSPGFLDSPSRCLCLWFFFCVCVVHTRMCVRACTLYTEKSNKSTLFFPPLSLSLSFQDVKPLYLTGSSYRPTHVQQRHPVTGPVPLI